MSHRLNGNGRVAVNVVRCDGDLNASRMVQMKSRFSRLINRNRRFFLLDLKEANHADLAGLGILIDRIRRVRTLKGDIRLFNLRPEVAEILRMIGLNQVIATYATEEEARRSFQVA
ncbi:MAG: hypothetical protein A3C35_06710 [Omnitrophica bacterium RIFCSPHIGHO2_02_FULL_46_11]|nr:MAG: hypothetical protein A3C35_06710 [Omnitrophica bacterium RIFCSPHIGHO2_02_FULL_46_11]OGW86725.1 MAG: hypothetical protein A3A81_08610 [Omnitrophica bacterium RIFCSPLOWO2_01_FULL_45_10b]